jgi:class 3 adenylate cyclase/tetratricopeptide (TPR) repeat protein
MNCPRCQTVNPDGAKFCMNCGASLAIACPNCATELPASAKFCFNCGQQIGSKEIPASQTGKEEAKFQRYMPRELKAKLDAARESHSMEGERRIVTILFCDVKGSTSMAEMLDPEEWADIMNEVFERMIAPVYKYEGTIARLMGDAILAFFGAPIAHEDDPQRTILAGLGIVENIKPYREKIKRERGLDFDVRVGINTGLVVVGEVGSDLRVEYTVMGDAVNLAARMEQTAQPGTVQISEHTHKLIEPLFDLESLGGIEVKGKREPVFAYRPLRLKAQPGRLRGIEGLNSPLIGRDREINVLKARVEDLARGNGQIVSVIGEAGLGKSRLISELRNWLTSQDSFAASPIIWYEGRSLSYQSATPHAPLIDLFQNIFGLHPDDNDADKYAKIKTRLSEILSTPAEEIAPFIASLLELSIPGPDAERVVYLDPPQLRERTFHAITNLLRQVATTHPLVLVFEDLHWSDASSLNLLEKLTALTDTVALMIIALFRPQRLDLSWHFHEAAARDYAHRYTALALEPLDETQARSLVSNLLHIEGLPEKVRQLILQKAEGNPFFVEEVIRTLLDAKLVVRDNEYWRATREIENIALPDTLAGVITARLDRLDEDSKRVAQTAAVIGREFQSGILEAIYNPVDQLNGALGNLQQRELIRAKSRIPELVYLFKHVLTQETAYSSMLLSKRRDLHRRVAECLERTEPHRINEIARHFLEAQEAARALPYLVEAAGRAAHSYSTPEAITYYTQALEVIKSTNDQRLARQVYEGLGNALMLAGDIPRTVETFEAMIIAANAAGDTPMKVSGLNKLAYVKMMGLGQFGEAIARLDDAESLARKDQDQFGLAEMFNIRCMMCTVAADFEGVIRYMGESSTLARNLGIKQQLVHSLDHIAATHIYMTDYEKVLPIALEGLQLAREMGDRVHEASILGFALPMYYIRAGDLDKALELAQEGFAISSRIGAAYNLIFAGFVHGEILRARGDYEAAIRSYEQSIDAARPLEASLPFMLVMPMAALGTTYIEMTDTLADRALEMHHYSLRLLEHPAGTMGGGTAWADIGFCTMSVGNLAGAAQLFEKGLITPTVQMMLQKPRFFVGQALLALANGHLDEAAKHVGEARAYAEERSMAQFYPLISLTDGRVSAAQGNYERALEQFANAEKLAKVMNLRPITWQAQAGAAQALNTLGRGSEAETKWLEAQAMIQEIGSLFTDEAMRKTFIEGKLAEIGRLDHTVS